MELFIERDYARRTANFWIKKEYDFGRQQFYHFNGEHIVVTTIEGVELSTNLKPFISVPMEFADNLIKAIADHANSAGIKTEKRDFVEGELAATKKHLEDLQKAYNKLLETVK